MGQTLVFVVWASRDSIFATSRLSLGSPAS
jgi:hypothetical protein